MQIPWQLWPVIKGQSFLPLSSDAQVKTKKWKHTKNIILVKKVSFQNFLSQIQDLYPRRSFTMLHTYLSYLCNLRLVSWRCMTADCEARLAYKMLFFFFFFFWSFWSCIETKQHLHNLFRKISRQVRHRYLYLEREAYIPGIFSTKDCVWEGWGRGGGGGGTSFHLLTHIENWNSTYLPTERIIKTQNEKTVRKWSWW